MNKERIRIINKSGHPLPQYKTEESAGCDLHAVIERTIILTPLERAFIPTGIHVELPTGYEATIRGRSGLNKNYGLVVPVGTIDSDYRGEIGVVIYNLSNNDVIIEDGERIAQLVISPVVQADWVRADELSDTERGEGGFGHTGK